MKILNRYFLIVFCFFLYSQSHFGADLHLPCERNTLSSLQIFIPDVSGRFARFLDNKATVSIPHFKDYEMTYDSQHSLIKGVKYDYGFKDRPWLPLENFLQEVIFSVWSSYYEAEGAGIIIFSYHIPKEYLTVQPFSQKQALLEFWSGKLYFSKCGERLQESSLSLTPPENYFVVEPKRTVTYRADVFKA